MDNDADRTIQYSDWKAFLVSRQWKALDDVGQEMGASGQGLVKSTREEWLSAYPMDGD